MKSKDKRRSITYNNSSNEENVDNVASETRILGGDAFRVNHYSGGSAVRFIAWKKRSSFVLPMLLGSLPSLFLMDLYLNGAFLVTSFSTWIKLFLLVLVLFVCYRLSRVRYQSILVIFGIGVQLETGFMFGNHKTFIEKSRIISTLIYDNMTYLELIPTLCLVVEDERSLIVPFSEFRIPMEKNIALYNTIKMV